MGNAVNGNRLAQWRFTQIVERAERKRKVAMYDVFERLRFGSKVAVSREHDLFYGTGRGNGSPVG